MRHAESMRLNETVGVAMRPSRPGMRPIVAVEAGIRPLRPRQGQRSRAKAVEAE